MRSSFYLDTYYPLAQQPAREAFTVAGGLCNGAAQVGQGGALAAYSGFFTRRGKPCTEPGECEHRYQRFRSGSRMLLPIPAMQP